MAALCAWRAKPPGHVLAGPGHSRPAEPSSERPSIVTLSELSLPQPGVVHRRRAVFPSLQPGFTLRFCSLRHLLLARPPCHSERGARFEPRASLSEVTVSPPEVTEGESWRPGDRPSSLPGWSRARPPGQQLRCLAGVGCGWREHFLPCLWGAACAYLPLAASFPFWLNVGLRLWLWPNMKPFFSLHCNPWGRCLLWWALW